MPYVRVLERVWLWTRQVLMMRCMLAHRDPADEPLHINRARYLVRLSRHLDIYTPCEGTIQTQRLRYNLDPAPVAIDVASLRIVLV